MSDNGIQVLDQSVTKRQKSKEMYVKEELVKEELQHEDENNLESIETVYVKCEPNDDLTSTEEPSNDALQDFTSSNNEERIVNENSYKEPMVILSEEESRFNGGLITEKKFCCEPNDVQKKEKPYVCAHCKKGFTQKQHLRQHYYVHTEIKRFSCDICGRTFSYNSNLKRHIRVHKDERLFSCDVCKLTFTDKSNLAKHQLTHSGQKKFPCNLCDAAFTHNWLLSRHFLTHSKPMPFSCMYCNRSFKTKEWVMKHVKQCHLDIHLQR